MIAIFKREMIGYFKNPTAYVVMAIYAVLSALLFCVQVIMRNTSYMGALFVWLFLVEMIVVAVMAMRFFSEEKKNRTDQLIMTSPVSLSGVVMGKYLAGMTLYTLCTMINLIYILIVDIYGTPDRGMNFTSMLGTILLGSCMVSIALFVSSLTENSLVAAGGTIVVFILMMLINFVVSPLRELLPAGLHFIPNSLGKLNLLSWFDNFVGGIISLDAVVFYLTLTASFLFLTTRVLERRRWR